jgi:hypothetical protein
MINLKFLFNRQTLDQQGALLARKVSTHLLNNSTKCFIDFEGISQVTPFFFKTFIFPLVIEFGSHAIDKRLVLNNMSVEHRFSYRSAILTSADYIDDLCEKNDFNSNDISDITFELMIKAREVSRINKTSARLLFGLNDSMIESISKMDLETLRKFSNSGIISFQPRFSCEFTEMFSALEPSEIDVFLNSVGNLDKLYDYD